jgi:hypothetical protein
MKEAESVMVWVNKNIPESIKFEAAFSEYMTIDFYLTLNTVQDYGTMTMRYGVLFTLAVLEYYIVTEQYEKCCVIRDAIARLNNVYNADLPTSIHDKWCTDNMHLTPLQILERFNNKRGN